MDLVDQMSLDLDEVALDSSSTMSPVSKIDIRELDDDKKYFGRPILSVMAKSKNKKYVSH